MGKILDWLVEMEKANPSYIRFESDKPQPKVINNYYITNDNRVIKVTQEEFKKIIKNKQIVDTTCKKLLE